MKAIRNEDFDSYWTQTSAAESLMQYISLDFDGLSKTVAELIGESAKGAIAQIKNNHYPDAIKRLGCDILLVGINYDKDAPAGKLKHTCVIERLEIE